MIENNRNKNINVQCVHCKKEYALFLNENDYSEWKEGNVLILLSPSTVNWLNRVDEWLSSSTVDSTTTYDYAST